MPHQSENAARLRVRRVDVSAMSQLPTPDRDAAEVWLFVSPFGRELAWHKALRRFARSLGERSILAILTSPPDAVRTWPAVGELLRFQLWVAVKLAEPIVRDPHQLPQHHAALLILSRYRTPLRHTTTRVAYSYCPACDKTTKDYGGEEHT